MADNNVDVLIVGAGATGLTLAIELLRSGLRVRLIDQQTDHDTGGRALTIHARTMELLEDLGLQGLGEVHAPDLGSEGSGERPHVDGGMGHGPFP